MSRYPTCKEIGTFLLAYLSGELAPSEHRRFERHLAVCPSCVAYLRTYRATLVMGRTVLRSDEPGSGEPAPEAPPELVRAVLARRGSDPAS
jgi:anti-sigma factor RsiW